MQDSGQGSVLIKHAVIHMGLLVCKVRAGKGKAVPLTQILVSGFIETTEGGVKAKDKQPVQRQVLMKSELEHRKYET